MNQEQNTTATQNTPSGQQPVQMIDTTAQDVAMSSDGNNAGARDDGFVDPTNSPKAANEAPLTAADMKVSMWKKMIIQGVCMSEILNELRNDRPDLNFKQLKLIFTLLLDRVYNQKEAHVQDQVCAFFAEELKIMLQQQHQQGVSGSTEKQQQKIVSIDTLDLIDFIFTEGHSIFNYRVSSNGHQLALKLAKQRYPDSEQAARRDADFIQGQYENNVAFFSHYLAHLALTLQITTTVATTPPPTLLDQDGQQNQLATTRAATLSGLEVLVQSAGKVSVSAFTQVLALVTKLKKFIRPDTWPSLARMLQDVSQSHGVSDEALKLSKKELVDFTEDLEHVLLYAYNQAGEGLIKPSASASEVAATAEQQQQMTDEQKVEESARQEAEKDLRRRDFIYRVPELIQLEYAIRCLEMPVLEKKLAGATILITKVVSVNGGKNNARLNQAKTQTNVQMKKWLSQERLIDWLREKKIFGVFFGTSLHPEVIKKSFYLLDFLYQHGELTERELQKMWHIATKKHEAFKVSVMRALIFMAARMAPKELNFLFNKLQAMQLREHDKFSLALLKAIAKALAPLQRESLRKQAATNDNQNNTALTRGMLEDFDKNRKPRGRAGSFDDKKPTDQLDGGLKGRKGLNLQNLDLLGGVRKKRGNSNDSMKANVGGAAEDSSKKPPGIRRQKSFSPTGRKGGSSNLATGLMGFDFKPSRINEDEDAELQRAIAMSMQQAEQEANKQMQQQQEQQEQDVIPVEPLANTPQSPDQPKTGNAEFTMRAEDLFDVPIDKQSKKTGDGEFSPMVTEEDLGGGSNKTGDIAAKALDLPFNISHSPQTTDNMPVTQISAKINEDGDDDQTNIKVTIGDHFFNDSTLGLVNCPEEIERKELAQQVLNFMWQLCLDDSVFGGHQANSNLPFESQGPRSYGRSENNSAQNRIEASLRPRKGLSVHSHQICIEQLADVINFNFPATWFSYVRECNRRLKANQQGMTMQLIIRKLLLGTQFPMMDPPEKPESITQLAVDLNDEAAVLSLPQDTQQVIASYKEQARRVKALPRSRVVLLNTLEEEIGLSGACLASYICFKSEALQLIYAYNFGNVHEEEYLETQSSLDGDDDKLMQNTSVHSGGDLVGQQASMAILSEPRGATIQSQMDVDITSEDHNTLAGSIDPSRINDRLQHQVMQVAANRIQGSRLMSQDALSLEEGKEEFKHPQSARLPSQAQLVSANVNGRGDSRSFLDTMITNRVYNYTFAKEMSERLDFLRFLVAQSPESMLKPQQIQVMWECLVSNAYYEKERDMFFGWCTDILLAARRKQNARQSNGVFEDSNDFFSDDCLELIFFDTLLKLDFRFFTDAIYTCFESFFIHVNEQYGQIVTTFQTQLEIFDFKLIGIEALIEIVLQVRDQKVHEKASTFLMKIYKSMNKEMMDEKIAEVKMDLLSVCMGNIRKGQQELTESGSSLIRSESADFQYGQQILTAADHQNRVARSIQILSKFIEQFEGYKDQQSKQNNGGAFNELGDPEVKVIINNQVSQTQGPTKLEMMLRANSTTVQMIMEQVSTSIFPKRDISELTLTYKGKDLKENLKTLKQVMGSSFNKVEACIMILSSKSQIEMEYMDQELAIFGTKVGTNQIDPTVLQEKTAELKMFLGETDCPDEVVGLALKKCNLNLEEAIGMVITEESVAELQAELVKEQNQQQENSNLMVIAKDAPKLGNEGEAEIEEELLEDKLNLIVSNKAEYFDLLFELLNLGMPDITQAVWKLMMQVPINQKLFNSMRSLQSIQLAGAAQVESIVAAESSSSSGWQSIIDPNSPYKMLYSLQILNTLVSVNNQLLNDIELQERHEWRQRFLELGGFTHLYMILITSDISEMLTVYQATNSGQNDQSLLGKKTSFGALQQQHQQQRQFKKSRSKLIKSSLQQNQIETVQSKKGQGNKVDQARCLSYLISIVKIFLHAALLTVDYENLLTLVVQSSTSPFRNDRKTKAAQHTGESDPKALEQLVTQGLTEKPLNPSSNSYGREQQFGVGSDGGGSRAGNTSGTGTPKFGSDNGGSAGVKTPTENKPVAVSQNTSMHSGANVRPKNTYTQVDDFPRLVEQMKSNGIAQLLLDQVIDFAELMRKLLQIIYTAVIHQEEEEQASKSAAAAAQAAKKSTTGDSSGSFEHQANEALSELLQHALDLMLPCLIWQPELLLKEIYDFESLEKLLIRALTQTQDETARKAVERTFKIICTHKLKVSKGAAATSQINADDMLVNARMQSPKVHILQILLKNLPGQDTQLTHCEEFFNLIASIIRSCGENFVIEGNDVIKDISGLNVSSQQDSRIIDLKRLILDEDQGQLSASYLLQVFVEQIQRRPILETRASSTAAPDKILSGYLQITQALLEASPPQLKAIAGSPEHHNLAQTLFQFLFDLPNQQPKQMMPIKTTSNLLTSTFAAAAGGSGGSPSQQQSADLPKCKSRITRKRTFNLLHTLCVGQPANYTKLLSNLFGFHKEIEAAIKVANSEQIDDFLEGLVNPNSSQHAMRAASGYVGLRNFGCTCYMNSLIQQLFMIPELRAGILQAELPKQIEPTMATKLVLRELQSTFANLQESVKDHYAPHGFIKSFQFHGEPVNVREQQDTHEFYNVLCDYLESSSPEVAQMLKSSVGGVLCNEIKSLEKEYAYVGETDELFSALSLDIKNKRRLQDALDLYVRPDVLDGDNKYYCGKHERKVDAQKRTYIKSLSDTVVINLKRFEYDFQTLQRFKINDYCEFPELIDFRPWTKQGIEEQENAQHRRRRVKRSGAGGGKSQSAHGAPTQKMMDDEEEEYEESPDLQEDEEMIGDEDIGLSDQVSQGDDDGQGSLLDECGRFSENDQFDYSDNSRPNNTEEGDGDFEDFIAQEEEIKGAPNGDKPISKARNTTKKAFKPTKFSDGNLKQAGGSVKTAKEGNEYLYRLVGVLVHSGSANSGHYYSYIKERSGQGRWLEFNDRVVKEFDYNDLAKECFGTLPEKNQNAAKAGSNMHFISWERHSNAYLLFYERVHSTSKPQIQESTKQQTCTSPPEAIKESDKQKPLPLVDNSDVIMGTSINEKVDADPLASTKDEAKLVNNMMSDLHKAIHAQNQAFMQLKLFYDAEYFQFIRDFVSQFKNTINTSQQQSQQESEDEFKNPLYFSKSDSQSYKQKRLVKLTEEFKNEQAVMGGAQVDIDKYIIDYDAIVAEGDIKELDIFQDTEWATNLQKDPNLMILKFAMTISFDIALKVKDVNGFVQWMHVLEPLFARSAHSCLWFIKYMHHNKKVLNALLLENPSYEVRESFSRLLKTALSVTIKNEEPYFLEESTYLEFSHSSKPLFLTASEFQSAAIRFCQYFFGEMLDIKVRDNWRRYEEYFDILSDFTQSSYPVARFMIEKQQGIYRMLEFVMNKQPPFAKSNLAKMGGGTIGVAVQPSLRQPLDLLSYLIRSTMTSGITTVSKYAPTSVFQQADRNFSIPASEIHFLLRAECLTELLNRCADAYSEDALKALTGIVEHLSWGDRNVSQFFINQLIEYIKTKQVRMSAGQAGQAGLPGELETAFRILRGLLGLQDEPLQKERCTFVFDLQGFYVDSKPFLTMLEQLRSRNAKFVLYGLAFVAEVALSTNSDDQTHQLVSYLLEHKSKLQLWILQFLEYHAGNAASPLGQACTRTIENALALWRQILQVTEPLTEQDMELGAAQLASSEQNPSADVQMTTAQDVNKDGSAYHGFANAGNLGSGAAQDQEFYNFAAAGESHAGSNQFEIDVMGLDMEQALDEIEQPASPRDEDQKGNISFDDMNQSFN